MHPLETPQWRGRGEEGKKRGRKVSTSLESLRLTLLGVIPGMHTCIAWKQKERGGVGGGEDAESSPSRVAVRA